MHIKMVIFILRISIFYKWYIEYSQINFHIPGSYTIKFFISKGNIKAEPLIQHCDVDFNETEGQAESSTPKKKRGKKPMNLSKRKQYPVQIVPQSKRPRKISVTRYEELPANMTKTLWSKNEVIKEVGKELIRDDNF